MNNNPSSPLPEDNGRLLQIYKNKQQNNTGKEANEGGLPTLKKSISRSLLNSNISPTRPNFKPNTPTAARGGERQLTIENVAFPSSEDNHLLPTKRSSSTPLGGDNVRSIESISSSRSQQIYTNNNKRQQKKKASNSNAASSFINPTDIFAQNLSDAVMDADDSDDLECYVYRDKPHHANNSNSVPNYASIPPPPPPWSSQHNNNNYYDDYSNIYDRHYSSTGTDSESTTTAGGCNKEKYYSARRPILRSTVSEIPHHSLRHHHHQQKRFSTSGGGRPLHYHYNPSEEEEEFTYPVRSRPLRRRKGTNSYHGKSNGIRKTCFTLFCVIMGCLSTLCFLWTLLVIYSSPLADVEVVGISNVLGTQKELIFNLQVRARNSNWWTIRMTNTAFSVFASSHYVPTALMMLSLDNTTVPNITSIEAYQKSNNFNMQGADPAEFLGTITHLEDPLIYQSGGLFKPVISTATSQIQIKSPGSTKDDNSGNERWSLLIRYPYELTVRGVLKYQILPYLPTLTQLHSVRVCKMSRIDPATGKISDTLPPEKSICDDPSPVEGSSN